MGLFLLLGYHGMAIKNVGKQRLDEWNLGKTLPGREVILIQGWLNDRTEGVWERAVLSFFCFSSRAQMKEITLRFGQFSHSRPLSLSRLCESGGPPRANWWLQKEFIFVVVLGETGCVLFSVCPWTPQFIHPVQSGQRVAVSLTWTIHFLFCVLIYKHSISVSLYPWAQNSEYGLEYFTAFWIMHKCCKVYFS